MIESEILSDKNLLDRMKFNTDDVIIPKTIANVVNNKWYVEGNLVSKKDTLSIVYKEKEVVAKVSVGSSSGRGVKFLDLKSMTFEDFKKEIDEWEQDNIIFQECIEQHEQYNKLNPSSVNTIRAITYIAKDKVYCVPIVMIIGRLGAKVDNDHAGGIFIGVENYGYLKKEAYTEFGARYSLHPDTKEVFEGYNIPMIPEIIESAKQLHSNYPGMHFISWDFTVDRNEKINLIEVNLVSQAVWITQIAHGESFFGNNSEYMASLARSNNIC